MTIQILCTITIILLLVIGAAQAGKADSGRNGAPAFIAAVCMFGGGFLLAATIHLTI